MTTQTEKWGYFELSITATVDGNPFSDVDLEVLFTFKNRTVQVDGFYDGDNTFKARLMPDAVGTWQYETRSNVDALNGRTGTLECTAPSSDNHGPVRVIDNYHFAYEDGTPYHPVGTTCYVWNHQGNELEEQTLNTLKTAPFNKMRMCVFPKRYVFNKNEPQFYPFEGKVTQEWEDSLLDNYRAVTPPDFWDFSLFNPEYFRHLEQRILDLCAMNIEADIIIFHPYDFGGWGFDRMPAEVNDRYLKYLVARIAAFRNVWWSFANEYDLMLDRTITDWDHYFELVQELDPYDHLRSNHNCREFYDHSKPWVTHCSIQNDNMMNVPMWLEQYKKPVVIDECGYEGDIHRAWGSLTPQELVARHWLGFAAGGYVGHGETYINDEEILWWSKGGELHGESPARIQFLRDIIEAVPAPGLFHVDRPSEMGQRIIGGAYAGITAGHVGDDYLLVYFWMHQQRFKEFDMPEDKTYKVDIIDTWNMTISPVADRASGRIKVEIPRQPYMAVRIQQVS